MDNLNVNIINGYRTQKMAENIYAIDEFGIDLMYLVLGQDKAMLVDTGAGIRKLKNVVEVFTEKPVFVVNTHGHMDHAMGNYEFPECYMNEKDLFLISPEYVTDERWKDFCEKTVREPYYDGPDLKNANLRLPQKLKPVEGGNKFDLGGYQYEVLETPGHTPGSIVLLDSENRILIAGDSIVSTPILIFNDYSTTVEEYHKGLLKLLERENEFDLILPGHFLRPIGKTYLYDLIKCAEKILDGTVESEIVDFSHMSSEKAIKGMYGNASIVYNEKHIFNT